MNTTWETRLKDSCAALQKQQEHESESARAILVEQHKAEAASLEAAWAAERHAHACSLEKQTALYADELAEVTQRTSENHHHALELHAAACRAMEEKGAAELAAAVGEADVQSRANLQQVCRQVSACHCCEKNSAGLRACLTTTAALPVQVVKHHTEEIMQVKAACQDQLASAHLQLETMRRDNDMAAVDLVQQWQRRCDDMRESVLAAQSAEHAAMQKAHEVALSGLQEDHAALVWPSSPSALATHVTCRLTPSGQTRGRSPLFKLRLDAFRRP